MLRYAAITLLVLLGAPLARAVGVTLPHAGYVLAANDTPLDGTTAMTFRIYTTASGGSAVWTGACSVDVKQGYYSVRLGDDTCGSALDSAYLPVDPPNYLEVSLGPVALDPRLSLVSVPVATLAANALAVGGLTLANFDTRYARIAAGSNPSLNAVLKWNGSAWAPGTDLDSGGTVTSVSASAPLVVTNGTTTPALSLPAASATTDGYVTATDWTRFDGKVAANDSRLTDARTPSGNAGGDLSGTYPSPGVAKIQGSAVAALAPATGQVLKWNGSAWAPAADDAAATVAGSALDFAQLEGGAQTFAANSWTAVTFNNSPYAQGISFSGSALTFARAGRYQVSITFRMDGSCSDVWTGARLFGNGSDRGHSAGSGTASPSPATYVFLADVTNATLTYQLQIGRLNGACTLAGATAVPDPTNSVPTTPPTLVATIVQVGSPVSNIVASGAGRRWSDATYATSCNAYRYPTTGFLYDGLTGDGLYTIDPDGPGGTAAFDVYCDMTTDAGGWTLLATLATTNVGSSGWPSWSDTWWTVAHNDPTSTTSAFSNHDVRKFRPIVTTSLVLRVSSPLNAVKRFQWGMQQADWDLWNAGRTVSGVNVVGPFNLANVLVSTSSALTGGVQSRSNGHWSSGYFYLGTLPGGGDADSEGIGARYHVMSNASPSYGYVGNVRASSTWNLWVK